MHFVILLPPNVIPLHFVDVYGITGGISLHSCTKRESIYLVSISIEYVCDGRGDVVVWCGECGIGQCRYGKTETPATGTSPSPSVRAVLCLRCTVCSIDMFGSVGASHSDPPLPLPTTNPPARSSSTISTLPLPCSSRSWRGRTATRRVQSSPAQSSPTHGM